MIVKGTKAESVALDRCLHSVKDSVDAIFITITQPSQDVEDVCKKYNAHTSHFEWCMDFAKARNFAFQQVPKEYSHILWLDADDVVDNFTLNLDDSDAFSMYYIYHLDDNGDPDVVHLKTRIVRNNGSTRWVGRIHEDLQPTRDIKVSFLKGPTVVHKSDDVRVEDSKVRNLAIAIKMHKDAPEDPRSHWNLANAYKAAGNTQEAIEAFNTFFKTSLSDEEKYIAHLRIAEIYMDIDLNVALTHAITAVGMFPEYPDAYNMKGHILFGMNRYDEASRSYQLALVKKPPEITVNVWNPRDYDFFPMLNLAKCFINLGQPLLAEPLLAGCLQIMPNRKDIARILKKIQKEGELQKKVYEKIEKLKALDDVTLKKELAKLPKEQQSHPVVCHLRNTRLIKQESSGKDVVIYCYHTDTEWNPELMKTKGFGGSEEAVMNLAKQWSRLGLNVTVYNNSGWHEQKFDGVTYKPTWMWNYRDKQDVVILWRTPKALDYEINADKVFVDVHDVIGRGEFTQERLDRATKILFKTQAHRDNYPDVPEDKVAIIPNGMDFELFDQDVKKDQYLMVNTSSPDRSMDVLPKLFKEVKKRVPEAKCTWAYGFDIFDIAHAGDAAKMKWKEETVKAMEEAGIENLGRVTQKDAAKLYLEANILAYPTEFFEIDCITVKKAQACGAIPVTTDFGALDESVKTGAKVHSKKTFDTWAGPYQFHFGLEDEDAQKEWVDACVDILQKPIEDRSDMKKKMEQYRWDIIAQRWYNIMYEV